MREIILKTKNVVVVLFILSVASACNDYLDQPVNGNLSEDEFYKTENDALNGLTAAYDAYSNVYNAIWPSMYLIREIPSDDVNAGGSDQNDQAGFQQIDDFTHDSQNDQVQGAWRNVWAAVYRANKVIAKTDASSDVMKRFVAEAKVLRAFLYMDLVSMWGGVPLITDDIPAADYTTQVRASKDEVLSLIEQDLTEAIPDLPLKSAYSAADKYRASKGTAQALLGKALLYHENYANALTQFEAVINSGEFDLEDEVTAVFDITNEFGKESLFELNYIGDGRDWGSYDWSSTKNDNVIVQLMGPRGDYYVQAPGDSLTGGWGFNTPTDEVYQAYVSAGDTDRRQRFIESQAELEAAGGDWTNNSAWDYEGYFRRKYGHFSTQSGGPVGELNYATNFVLLRYADVLLMAAEAANKSGNDVDAVTYLNMVRARPSTNLAPVVATGAALFDAIVLERRLELAFEGHRFVDLVRWGLADDELGDLGFVAGKHEVLPIPNADVIAAKLIQNPNY
jgi:starch-binding outer membrane protein, SusD/RagB family